MKKVELDNKQILNLLHGKVVKYTYEAFKDSPYCNEVNILGTDIITKIKGISVIPSSDLREIRLLSLKYNGRLVKPKKVSK